MVEYTTFIGPFVWRGLWSNKDGRGRKDQTGGCLESKRFIFQRDEMIGLDFCYSSERGILIFVFTEINLENDILVVFFYNVLCLCV